MKKTLLMSMVLLVICTGCSNLNSTVHPTTPQSTKTSIEVPIVETDNTASNTTMTTEESVITSKKHQKTPEEIACEWLDGFISGEIDIEKFWDDYIIALDIDMCDKDEFIKSKKEALFLYDYTEYMINDIQNINDCIKVSFMIKYTDINGTVHTENDYLYFSQNNGEYKFIYGPINYNAFITEETDNELYIQKIEYLEYVEQNALKVHIENKSNTSYSFGWATPMKIHIEDINGDKHSYTMPASYKLNASGTSWYQVEVDLPITEISKIYIDNVQPLMSNGLPMMGSSTTISVTMPQDSIS